MAKWDFQTTHGHGIAFLSVLYLSFCTSAYAEDTRADVFWEMERQQQLEIMIDNVNTINQMAIQNDRQDISACIQNLFNREQNPDVPGFGIFVQDLITVRALSRDDPEILDQMPVERILFRIVERECIE